jgi:PHD/YefM family antitoxin component YafN of YafNO toxin-antitoxin module
LCSDPSARAGRRRSSPLYSRHVDWISYSPEERDIIITRHGKPAGVLIGFETEDDWFEYRLEHDPRFLRRVSEARADIAAGRGVRLEAV